MLNSEKDKIAGVIFSSRKESFSCNIAVKKKKKSTDNNQLLLLIYPCTSKEPSHISLKNHYTSILLNERKEPQKDLKLYPRLAKY